VVTGMCFWFTLDPPWRFFFPRLICFGVYIFFSPFFPCFTPFFPRRGRFPLFRGRSFPRSLVRFWLLFWESDNTYEARFLAALSPKTWLQTRFLCTLQGFRIDPFYVPRSFSTSNNQSVRFIRASLVPSLFFFSRPGCVFPSPPPHPRALFLLVNSLSIFLPRP